LAAHVDEQTTLSNSRYIGIQPGLKVRKVQLPVEIAAQ
jgi:hypothetical protein